jgi:hypothetical protein
MRRSLRPALGEWLGAELEPKLGTALGEELGQNEASRTSAGRRAGKASFERGRLGRRWENHGRSRNDRTVPDQPMEPLHNTWRCIGSELGWRQH